MTTAANDAYWQAKMANREHIDAEKHARFVEGRMTRYTDLSAVQAEYDAWADAHDDYVRAYRDFWATVNAIVPKEDQRYPAWERDAPESVQAAMHVHTDVFSVTPSMGVRIIGMKRYSHEMYPVSRWQAAAKKYRTAARKLRKATEAMVQTLCERF